MKRIAIPVSHNKLSNYFGNCNSYKIFEIKEEQVFNEYDIVRNEENIENLPEILFNQNITDIVSHKIDKRIISEFSKYKIHLYVGIQRENPELIIQKYLQGSLISDVNIIKEIIE